MTTLLAVEDSKTIRKAIEITFAGEDHRLVLAESSDQALAKLQSEQPKVVLVDANLEGGRGYDLCGQIKQQVPGTAVLILSSKQQPYDRVRGGAAGADDFIDKPFDTQQLIDKVANLASKAAAAPAPQPARPAVQPAPASQPSHPIPERAPAGYAPAAAQPGPARPQTLVGTPAPAVAPIMSTAHAAPAPAAAPRPAVPAAVPAATAPAASALSNGSQFAEKLGGLGLTNEQVQAVLALSRDVVETVVWEVVPVLAETIIREEIQRLTKE